MIEVVEEKIKKNVKNTLWMQCEVCVAARWWNYIFSTQKLQHVRIHLVHSSLLNHTEQAYHPKPKKRKRKRSCDYSETLEALTRTC